MRSLSQGAIADAFVSPAHEHVRTAQSHIMSHKTASG
jgi:hypothetical protein